MAQLSLLSIVRILQKYAFTIILFTALQIYAANPEHYVKLLTSFLDPEFLNGYEYSHAPSLLDSVRPSRLTAWRSTCFRPRWRRLSTSSVLLVMDVVWIFPRCISERITEQIVDMLVPQILIGIVEMRF